MSRECYSSALLQARRTNFRTPCWSIPTTFRSEEHTSELQSRQYLHSFPTRRSSDLKHHSHEEIARFYRASSFCMVTSLHDGMNLVAKEYVASREDEQGVLLLSTFAGAAHELSDALLVNPYDV